MRHTFFYTIMFLLGLLAFLPRLNGQIIHKGPQVETFYSVIDDSEQPYGLYVPRNYDSARSYPLVIMLHGAGSNHRLALKRVFGKSNLPGESDAIASRYFQPWDDVDYIVAAPFARGTMGYEGIPEADVLQVIDECFANFNIDRNRVYLTGLSMGGGGTLYIGLSHPDLFAAIAPVCPAPPAAFFDVTGNALNLPVAIFQGGADPVVKSEGVRQIVSDLQDAGTMVEYVEFPGVQHNVWENAYADGAIFKWFDGIERNPFPNRVRYATRWYRTNGAYWVTIDRLTPGSKSEIDARFTTKNQLEVTTKSIEAFTLELKGHPLFDATQPLVVRINGQSITSKPKWTHAFLSENGKWSNGKYVAPAMAKKAGLEGPLGAALNTRHIYVYGTLDNPSMEEAMQRRAMIRKAADFSIDMGWYALGSQVNPRVISDREVTEADIRSSNLILFGTSKTNALIARYANQLPLELSNTSDYGLVYIFPVTGRYVVVSSGIPFWQSSPDEQAIGATTVAGRVRYRFSSATDARILTSFPDFILFKGGNNNIISEGYFNHDWTLSAESMEKIKAIGDGVILVK